MTETIEDKQTVLFDPGYAKHTTILSLGSEYLYSSLDKIKNFNQKKSKFKMIYPQLLRMADNNTGFCLGSMLWAVYVKSLGDIEIEGNPCLGDTYNEKEAVEEVDFSIAFFDRLKKDAKYYLNLEYNVNPQHIKVLELYRVFLTENCSFVNTRTTNDIILPDGFTIPDSPALEKINAKISEVVNSGNLLDLFEVWDLVYRS